MKKFIILTIIIITSILFFSCDMESMEGKGTLVIRLPGESGSARTLTQPEKDKYLSELKYSIECSGPASMIKRDAGAGETVPLYLTSGRYNITVTVTNKNGRVIGSETKTETIEAGEKKSVDFNINLDEPVYLKTNNWSSGNDSGFNWCIGWGNIGLNEYYNKQLANNNMYTVNILGCSNKDMHDFTAFFWLYRGPLDQMSWENNDWELIGMSQKDEISIIEKGKLFNLSFEIETNFSVNDLPFIKDPRRIYFEFTSDMSMEEGDNEDLVIKAAITHFNMTVKESLSFDMVVWSDTSSSGWSSGHDRNTLIYVVPEYLPSIKSNTMYKITAKGRSNADMTAVNGQFQLGTGNEATDHNSTFGSKINFNKDENFNAVFYVATNSAIDSKNQRNVIFNLGSNYSENPSNEAGIVKATITNFSMTIEEVISGENGLIFKLNDEGSEFIVRGSDATKGVVTIPAMWSETINSKSFPVTEIADHAFENLINITSVNIGSNVKIIGDWSFIKTGTTSVNLPNSLISIGDNAFSYTNLTRVTIPANVEVINSAAFHKCPYLTSVSVLAVNPPQLKGQSEFETFSGNEAVIFCVPQNSLTAYQNNSDWGSYGADKFYAIESIVFSLSDYLAENKYGNNDSINRFNAPLEKEYDAVSKQVHFTIVNNGINITNRSQDYHGVYISIDVPSLHLHLDTNKYKITVIGNLLNTPYPDSGITIQGADDPWNWIKNENASSTSLITVSGEIPSDFLTKGNRQISICTTYQKPVVDFRISNIIIEKIGTIVLGNNGLIFSYKENGTFSVKGSASTSGNVVIPEDHEGNQITEISADAFIGNTKITGVSIPASVTSIGYRAFNGCSNLEKIELPTGLTYLGSNAFQNCSKLTGEIIIPFGVEEINDWTFKNTRITNVEIPGSVKRIGQGAFSSTEADTKELSEVIIREGVKIIDEYAFERQSKLTSITLPASVNVIHSGAFYNCTNLSSVTILAVTPPVLMQLGKQNNGDALSIWFYDNADDRKFYVPDINAYKAEPLWSTYFSSDIYPIP